MKLYDPAYGKVEEIKVLAKDYPEVRHPSVDYPEVKHGVTEYPAVTPGTPFRDVGPQNVEVAKRAPSFEVVRPGHGYAVYGAAGDLDSGCGGCGGKPWKRHRENNEPDARPGGLGQVVPISGSWPSD